MALTRQQLVDMDEDALRIQILLPLLEAMGFKGVHLYHGGDQELGKDVLMWKPEEFSPRVNYVVVAKATPIKGNVEGKDSYQAVVRQIHQSFGRTYLDRTTLKDISTDKCIVVTSKEFKKEAQNAICGELRNTHLDKVTQFIDGDELWRLVDRFLGKRTVWSKLNEVAKVLDEASPHYRLVINTSGNQRVFSLEPKHPNAHREQPVSFAAKFMFASDEEGKKAREILDQHFKTGAEASIPAKFIKTFQMPEFLRPYLEENFKISEIKLGASRFAKKLLVNMQICASDGQIASLTGIELINERAGIEEMVFSNKQQDVPWRLEVVMNLKNNTANFSLHTSYRGFNVKQELEGIRFEKMLSQGGILQLIIQETGLPLGSGEVSAGQKDAPPPHWIRLIEMLAAIQTKTQIALQIPENRTVLKEEAKNISRTAQIVETGSYCFAVETLEFNLGWEAAKKFIENATGGSGSIMEERADESTTILGKKINLGPVRVFYYNFSIEPQTLEGIKQGIAEKHNEIAMKLIFNKELPCRAVYSKWNPKSAGSVS